MTTLPQTQSIRLTLEGGWLSIDFATPENRNALTTELSAELMETLDAVRDDRSVRGITLRGDGGVFCAGGDLKHFKAAFQDGDSVRDDVVAANLAGAALFERINAAPQVVIALVEGAAIAGGLGVACCADVVVVERKTKFALTETQLGIIPAQIAPHVARRIGVPAARRLMLTGAHFTGDEAGSLGIADRIVDGADELDAAETAIKEDVARCAPGANAA
ncbi:MAG: enoyl-CoA hydratase/isomerase family protein, partial [Pseudomonadota bacterium]